MCARPRHETPRPPSLPFLGHAFDVPDDRQWLQFDKWIMGIVRPMLMADCRIYCRKALGLLPFCCRYEMFKNLLPFDLWIYKVPISGTGLRNSAVLSSLEGQKETVDTDRSIAFSWIWRRGSWMMTMFNFVYRQTSILLLFDFVVSPQI